MQKTQVVTILQEMGAILEITGANPFRVRAFKNGAQALADWEGDLAGWVADGRITEISGIGKGLASLITDLVTNGGSKDYDDLCELVPRGVLEMRKLPGLGPKKVALLYNELGVSSIAELKDACEAGEVSRLKGFAKKTEDEILARIARTKRFEGRHRIPAMERVAAIFRDAVAAANGTESVTVSGSLRRHCETIGDIDILCISADPGAARDAFLAVPEVLEHEAEGDTKCRVVVADEIGVDLRVVEHSAAPAALMYFTGNKQHNTILRGRARERGWKLNEYGLFDENGRALPGTTEADLYKHLGLAYVPPELREGMGEVDLAATIEEWPELLQVDDLQGVVHCHTTASDGRNTLEEMVAGAVAQGWGYLGIAEHSRSAGYVGGLSIDALRARGEVIAALNAQLDGFAVWHGTEVDILPDGALDYPDDVLAELDYVVASVHSHFSLSKEEQTARIEAALRNPLVSVWGHPTGRLLLKREGYDLDMDHLLQVAAAENVIVELNALPNRLDLDWRWGARARELGVQVGIFPDSHSVEGLADVRYGVGIARKGGYSKDDIVNTRNADDMLKALRQRR
ncbi:MAG: DNA polymerase/3'-5' exonuclease PolX [Planctomycetota bacterium]